MKKFILGFTSFLLLSVFASACIGGTSVDKAFNDNIRRGDGKVVVANTDLGVDIASGVVDDQIGVNISGLAPSGVQTTATDIWDRANSTPTQQIYIKPTVARVHQLKSSSTDDDGDPAGVGARTVRIDYLKDWDTPELSIVLVMNGTTNVATPALVFVNKMEVLTMGALANNVGAITLTADTDTTVSAVILASQGVTRNAFYGWSSLDSLHIKDWYGSIIGTGTAYLALELLINSIPDSGGTNTAYKHIDKRGLNATGISSDMWPFDPPLRIKGPAIAKIQGSSSLADIEGSAGFNGVMVLDTSGFNILVTSNSNASLRGRILTTSDGRILRTTQ